VIGLHSAMIIIYTACMIRQLNLEQARVLGTLIEKSLTVPDSYPLSLNSLTLGCNQKSSREPVTDLSEAQVLQALDDLRGQSLVFSASANRVPRYEHNAERALQVSKEQAVLIGLLLLRGPQTVSQLRINGERWHRFESVQAVEQILQQLVERGRDGGSNYVRLLGKAPGMREPRWAQLLAGEAALSADEAVQPNPGATDTPNAHLDASPLQARVERLEQEVSALSARLDALEALNRGQV
jgi:uncharacterized protein